MRILGLGVAAVFVLGAGLFALLYLERKPAHVSELVPDDFSWGVFYQSIEDLRASYEGPYRRKNFDPALVRIGQPVNVPGFDGMSFEDPAGSFVTADGVEIMLVPVVDREPFLEAFERERQNLNLREPTRPAANYLAVSAEDRSTKHGPANRLVLRALEYPMALAGRPRDGRDLRAMLFHFFGAEARRNAPGVRPLWGEVSRIPDAPADFLAGAIDQLVVGVAPRQGPAGPARLAVDATPAVDGALARAVPLAAEIDLAHLLGGFPPTTGVLAGAVLDERGWQAAHLPLAFGDGAFAAGITDQRGHPRRFNLILMARPRAPQHAARLDARVLLDDPAADVVWETVQDKDVAVRSTALAAPPAAFADLLRSDVRNPPPVYLATAVADGVWIAVIGSQAVGKLRECLLALRARSPLSIRSLEAVSLHPGLLEPGILCAGFANVEGLKAFRYPMPYVDVAAAGQPATVTFHAAPKDGEIAGEIRLHAR